jgi:hypothetical protein
MATHVKVLGVLYIALSAFGLCAAPRWSCRSR